MRNLSNGQRTVLASTFFMAVATVSCLATVLALTSCQRGGAAPNSPSSTRDFTKTREEAAHSIDTLTPGAPVVIGNSNCTAGWTITFTGQFSGQVGFVTAGHCANGDHQAPVTVKYTPRGKSVVVDGSRNVPLGMVVAIPTDQTIDVAVVMVKGDPSVFGGISGRPGGSVVIGDKMITDFSLYLKSNDGQPAKACVMWGSTRPDASQNHSACGSGSEVRDGRLLLSMKPGVGSQNLTYTPELDGSPVWLTEHGKNYPAGIVTGQIDGKIVVTPIAWVLQKLSAKICKDGLDDPAQCAAVSI